MLAAVIGAAFIVGLQVGAVLSYGALSRTDVLRSQTLEAPALDLASAFWWPARAALGDIPALAAVLAASAMLFAAAILLLAPRFADVAIMASGEGASPAEPSAARKFPHRLAARGAPPQGMAPAAPRSLVVLQTLIQILYLLPPAILLGRTFEAGGGAVNLLVSVLVVAAGQLAGGLAWLSISGEDAPDLVATAPIRKPMYCAPRSKR